MNDDYIEGFDVWLRGRMKTHPDTKYWSEEEENAAEVAWCEAWDNAEKSFSQDLRIMTDTIKNLRALVARLEHENSYLESVNVQLMQGGLGSKKA